MTMDKTTLNNPLPLKEYEAPKTELFKVSWERLCADPTSWADGQGGVLPIIEGDPGGNGKGAKKNTLWDDEEDVVSTPVYNLNNFNLWYDEDEEE